MLHTHRLHPCAPRSRVPAVPRVSGRCVGSSLREELGALHRGLNLHAGLPANVHGSLRSRPRAETGVHRLTVDTRRGPLCNAVVVQPEEEAKSTQATAQGALEASRERSQLHRPRTVRFHLQRLAVAGLAGGRGAPAGGWKGSGTHGGDTVRHCERATRS